MAKFDSVPLDEYWYELAYSSTELEPLPSPPTLDDPTVFSEWEIKCKEIQATRTILEASAWDAVCDKALSFNIRIYAFRWRFYDRSLGWYPSGIETVRELIPAEFFLEPTKLGPGDPTVIYYADGRKGNVFNAPWHWPIVLLPASESTSTQMSQGRRGGIPKCDWELYRRRFAAKVSEVGFPAMHQEKGWQIKADVVRWLSDQISQEREELPASSTLQLRAGEYMDELNPSRRDR